MEVDASSSLRESDQTAVVENIKNIKVRDGSVCGMIRSDDDDDDDDKKSGENCVSDANISNPAVVGNSEYVRFEDEKNDSVCDNNSRDVVNASGENCTENEINSTPIEIKCSGEGEVQHKSNKVRPGKRDRAALYLNGQSKSGSRIDNEVNVVTENDTSDNGLRGTVSNSCAELPDCKRARINMGKQNNCTDTDTDTDNGTLESECRSNSKYCSSDKLVSAEGVTLTENSATAESDTDLESQKRNKNNRKKRQNSDDGAANENKQACMFSSEIRSDAETIPVSVLVTKEDIISGSCCASNNTPLHKILVSPGNRKLLVLDINGLLADINSDFRYTEHADFKISGKLVFKRPFCADFLNFCFANFEIGVWSSRKKYNVDKAVQYLMGDLRNQLLFCWDQSKCTATNFNTIDNSCKPLVFKELKKLWEKEEPDLPWEKGRFTPSNTLLVDDSPYKAFCNPPFTAIFPPPYSFKHKEDNSLGIGGDLRVYLEKLATAEHVQYYVKDNPFGQTSITDSHPNWKFYLRIIENLDKPLGSA